MAGVAGGGARVVILVNHLHRRVNADTSGEPRIIMQTLGHSQSV
jgi:hypothetical protein